MWYTYIPRTHIHQDREWEGGSAKECKINTAVSEKSYIRQGEVGLSNETLCTCIYMPLYYIGDVDVVNFTDVTAGSAFSNNTAVFEFKFDQSARLDPSFGYNLRLTWSQVSGPSSGVIEGAVCRYYRQPNAQLQQVGHTGTYRLYVPLRLLGDGRLLVNLTINMFCTYNHYFHIRHYYRYSRGQCGCSEWLISGTSDSLEINAKRG